MSPEQLRALRIGDIIRRVGDDANLIVSGNVGGRVTAVRTFEVMKPEEWELVMQSRYQVPLPQLPPPP